MNAKSADVATVSAPKARIIEAAFQLFSEHGVAGTSLQMIADSIGVTKAAVYHQFRTKDEIVLATGQVIYDSLADIAARAQRQPSAAQARAMLVDELIRLAVANRRFAGFLQRDPIMLRLLQEHEPFNNVMDSLNAILMEGRHDVSARVLAATLMFSVGGAVMHPLVADIDDESLYKQLRLLAQGLLRSPG